MYVYEGDIKHHHLSLFLHKLPRNTHYIYYSTLLLPFNVLQTIDPGWHLNPRPDSSDTVILFHREGNNSQRAWIIQRHPFHALV